MLELEKGPLLPLTTKVAVRHSSWANTVLQMPMIATVEIAAFCMGFR